MRMKEAIDFFSEWRGYQRVGSTVRGYDNRLRHLALFLHNPDIESITLKDVIAFLRGLTDMGWHENSLLGYSMAIRKFLEFYDAQGYRVIKKDLIPIPRKQFTMPRIVTKEQYDKLLSVAQGNDARHVRNRAIIMLLWDTGARVGEVVSLNESEIERCKATIRTEKNRGSRPFREIFWKEATEAALQEWLAIKHKRYENDALFLSCSGIKSGKRLTSKGVEECLRRYSHKAGMKTANPHSFRHARVHRIMEQTGDPTVAMDVMGWSSIMSVPTYNKRRNAQIEEKARRYE